MTVANHLHEQSADIAMGVDSSSDKDEGAEIRGSCSALPAAKLNS